MLVVLNIYSWYYFFEFVIDKIEVIFDSIYKYWIIYFIIVLIMLVFFNKFLDGFEDIFDNVDFKSIIIFVFFLEVELWKIFE